MFCPSLIASCRYADTSHTYGSTIFLYSISSARTSSGFSSGLWYRCSNRTFFVSQTRCTFIFQSCLVLEQFADLETNLRVFVRVEWRDTGLRWNRRTYRPDALPHTYQTEHGTASGSVHGAIPEYAASEHPEIPGFPALLPETDV